MNRALVSFRNFVEQVDGDGVRGVDDRCGSASEHVSGRWNKLDSGAARPLSGPPRARPTLDDGAARRWRDSEQTREAELDDNEARRGVGLLRLDRNAARLTLNAERTSSGLAAVRLGLRSTAVRLDLRSTAVRLEGDVAISERTEKGEAAIHHQVRRALG
uniref:Uncharacterized protein n=1 Tax=Ananas comosus var. bracteatus TaxID=296719 RepID=A0A6V7P9L7_ANACO|nr:unnamed protein product [Ananas comosus var. bracteatus]